MRYADRGGGVDIGAAMRAMILCAGYGTRLGSLTEELPRPRFPLAGRPMLEYIVASLARSGFGEIAVNLHFRPEVISAHFGDGSEFGMRLAYSYEPELLGTAGGVKRMEGYLTRDDCFLVHYGDVLTDQDFSAMLHFHRERRALGTLLLHRRARSYSVGEMAESGRIALFLERPAPEERPGPGEEALRGREETWQRRRWGRQRRWGCTPLACTGPVSGQAQGPAPTDSLPRVWPETAGPEMEGRDEERKRLKS